MRLNLGCGGVTPDGWVNIDRALPLTVALDEHRCLVHDLTRPLPFEDRSCEGAVLHHVIDLLDANDAWYLLRECARVLDLGAVLRISWADVFKAIARALAGRGDWFPEPRFTAAPDRVVDVDLDATLGFFITQGGARKWLCTAGKLDHMLRECGFSSAHESRAASTLGPEWLAMLDGRAEESAFMEAIR